VPPGPMQQLIHQVLLPLAGWTPVMQTRTDRGECEIEVLKVVAAALHQAELLRLRRCGAPACGIERRPLR